jgi:LPPG:FO 2-phospho-L-lactate transferase
MSDDPVRTRVNTPNGWLDFKTISSSTSASPQYWNSAFVGAKTANAHPEFLRALCDARLRAVVICPSNPFLSVDPILAIPSVRQALLNCTAPSSRSRRSSAAAQLRARLPR